MGVLVSPFIKERPILKIANIKKYDRMKVTYIPNFKTIEAFQEIKSKKRCWNKCHVCQNLWNQIQTENVHMIVHTDPEEFINGNSTFFVCDNCQSKIKEL